MIQSEITGTGNVRQINRSFKKKLKNEAVSKGHLVYQWQNGILRQPPLIKSKKHIYGQLKQHR